MTTVSNSPQVSDNFAWLFSFAHPSLPKELPIQRQERQGWTDYFVGDVFDHPVGERRSVLLPTHKFAFHYLSLHRTFIQKMGKPEGLSDDLWHCICEMIRRRQ